MPAASLALRASALLAAGALGLHELRYRVGYGQHADEALSAEGHGYLSLAAALAGVMVLGACLGFARSLLQARRGRGGARARPSLGGSWLAVSAALSAVYAGQESLERLLTNHPHELGEIVAHGGWTAFPMACAVAALIALLLRGASAAIALAASGARARPPQPRPKVLQRRTDPLLGPLEALARHLASRGPPIFLPS